MARTESNSVTLGTTAPEFRLMEVISGKQLSLEDLRGEQGTLVMLTQYDMPDDEVRRMHLHTNCRAAWAYFLMVLKTLLEQGVDGRDRTRATGSSLSTYFDPGAAGLVLSA